MTAKQSELSLYGNTHEVVMGYLDDKLFKQLKDEMTFQEIENLIGKWNDQGNIYHDMLINPDMASFRQGYEYTLPFDETDKYITVGNPDKVDADKNNLKRLEELTQIKSSKDELIKSLRNIPHYPKNPESRYITVFIIKSFNAFIGTFIINEPEFDITKVVFAQSNFQTIADIALYRGETRFNFLAAFLYDGELIEIDTDNSEGIVVSFDMWIYDTKTEKVVFTGDFENEELAL